MFILMGSFQSYWSLPIPDNMPAGGVSHLAKSFLRVFKMDILGDVNMHEFEGLSQKFEIHLNETNNQFTGSTSEAGESDRYHDAICMLVGILVTLVTILTMNVTIGVVGEAYVYNKSNANQIWCHYRSSYNIKMLLRHEFWKNIFRCVAFSEVNEPEVAQGKGIFIGCHEAYFLDANDTQECLRDIIGQEKEITEQLASLAEREKLVEEREKQVEEKERKAKELAEERQLPNANNETVENTPVQEPSGSADAPRPQQKTTTRLGKALSRAASNFN